MEAQELMQRAEARAKELGGALFDDAALERLRTDCLSFLDSGWEPPLYRRANDPARARALERLGRADELLARVMAARAQGKVSEALFEAVRAHVEALAATAEGRYEVAERAWLTSRERQEQDASARRLWSGTDDVRRPVYDVARQSSRYDPLEESKIVAKLVCPERGCQRVGDQEIPRTRATERMKCPHCGRHFWSYVGRVRGVEVVRSSRRRRHYRFAIEELSGAVARLDITDLSGAELSIARRDLMAFLYSDQRELRGMLNLSSRRVLWIDQRMGCFIATAVLGPEAPELQVFRAYRDQVLLRTVWGRAAVAVYYRAGPWLARLVARSGWARRRLERVLKSIHRKLRARGY